MSNDELKNQVPLDILPEHLGGNAKLNHKNWLAECHKLVSNKASTCSYYYYIGTNNNNNNNINNKVSSGGDASSTTMSTTVTLGSEGSVGEQKVQVTSSVNHSGGLNANRKRHSTSDFIDVDEKNNKKNTKKQIHENNTSVNGQYIPAKIEPLPFQN